MISKSHFCEGIECLKYSREWQTALQEFYGALRDCGDNLFFKPHSFDDNSLASLATNVGADLYYLLVQDKVVLGYGLLRGWEEGYEIPSLGIAIRPSERGKGLATLLMHYLHVMARIRGAEQVRLRVHSGNQAAIDLYSGLGYVFQPVSEEGYLVAYRFLKGNGDGCD